MTTRPAVLSPALMKEVSALFPTYGAALAAVVVGSFSESYSLVALGFLGFAFGSIALGAQSFGHEYSSRTLGFVLAQPLDRRRLFLYKFVVLAVMLVTLSGATMLLFQDLLRRAASPDTEPAMLMLVAACGLFVAPSLTMLSRSTLAAIVFTIAIPGLLATGGDLVGSAIYGAHNPAAIDRFKLLVFWRGMFVVCAVGAVASWRLFMKLEVIEGGGVTVELPQSLERRSAADVTLPSRSHHRVLLLLEKELRLHQLTFVVAALFTFGWLSMAWLERPAGDTLWLPLNVLAMLYAAVVALLIGAMASAEERHLGTAEWHMLLPMPAWQQWTVKAGVALGLAMLLGVALPGALRYIAPAGDDIQKVARAWRETIATIALLTSASLYVSSLCSSGVRALVLSLPMVGAAVLFIVTVGDFLGSLTSRLARRAGGRPSLPVHDIWFFLFAAGAGLMALLLVMGFGNHRWPDRSVARLSKQALAIAGYITIGLAVLMIMVIGW
jgi:hypothetical protein